MFTLTVSIPAERKSRIKQKISFLLIVSSKSHWSRKEMASNSSLLSIFCFSSTILSSASWLAMASKLRTAFSNLTLVGVGKNLYQGMIPIIGAMPSMKLSPADWNSFILGEGAVNKLRRLPKMNIPIPKKVNIQKTCSNTVNNTHYILTNRTFCTSRI